MSWPVVGLVTLVYWVVLFLRMRARGRRDFDRALEQAEASRNGDEPFEVHVAVEMNPLRTTAVVLAVPIALVVIHFFAARAAQ